MRKQFRAPRDGEILAWLDSHGYDRKTESHQSGPHARVSPAPCCAHAKRGGSLAINLVSGLWTCFACQAKGNWPMLCRQAGHPLPDPYLDEKPWTPAPMPVQPRRPVSQGHYPELLAYCLSRGLTVETLDAWRVSTCGPKNLRWPLFALVNNNWVGINARLRRVIDRDSAATADWFELTGGPKTAIGNHLLGTNPLCWRLRRPVWASEWLDSAKVLPQDQNATEARLGAVKRILVCEGQWDAMTAYQLGIPALSLPNGASAIDIHSLLRFVPEAAEVWLAMDADTAGERAVESFYAKLGTAVKRLHLPHKDLNAWLMAQPNLTAEDVLSATKPALAQGRKRKSLAEMDSTEMAPPGLVTTTAWPALNERIKGGLYECEVTSLLAPSGIGKTTIANEIIAYAALQGCKCGVIQLEGDRGKVIKTLSDQISGRGKVLDADESMIAKAKDNVIFSELAGKRVSVADTIEEIRTMLSEDGCKLVVIDNWDYITGDTENGQSLKVKAFAELQTLVKQYRAHGIAVWQPKKVDRNAVVNSGSQKGLSVVLQDSDNYLALNRVGMMRRIDVEKARVVEQENVSSVIWLKFEPELNCMMQVDSAASLHLLERLEQPYF